MAGEYTEEQLAALTARIARGEAQIKAGDESVTLADLEALQRLRDRMIKALDPTRRTTQVQYLRFNRGDR